jgi:phospholipid/cholesterol/gamma-HCH transport system ATP-binding protein
LAVIGGSGSGKSTLLREMILLHTPNAGRIKVLGVDLAGITDAAALALRQRIGVLFQQGGLFGALTVLENIGLPLREHRQLADKDVDVIAAQKLDEVGLDKSVASQYPSELSGGMLKRAALARALVLAPELLFLDEPTAGLDPQSAAGIDALVLSLRKQSGLTIVMITHDLDLLWQVTDRVAVLADGRVQAVGSMAELSSLRNASVAPFFDGPRARSAQTQAQAQESPQPKEPSSKPK